MKALLALAPLFLLGAADAPEHGPIFAGMPPERFMGEGITVVAYVNNVDALCGDGNPDTVALGCVRTAPDGRKITILPNPCFLGDSELFARIACHEKGHILGWTRNHQL